MRNFALEGSSIKTINELTYCWFLHIPHHTLSDTDSLNRSRCSLSIRLSQSTSLHCSFFHQLTGLDELDRNKEHPVAFLDLIPILWGNSEPIPRADPDQYSFLKAYIFHVHLTPSNLIQPANWPFLFLWINTRSLLVFFRRFIYPSPFAFL